MKIRCKRCQQDILLSDLPQVAETCVRYKCWIKKIDARNEAAKLTHLAPEDFVAIITGTINIHKDEVKHYPVNDNNFEEYIGQ